MDISAFYEDNFDTKTWINEILKDNSSQESKEAHTASLVKKLQIYVQQVNSSLEDASQQVLSSLPRVMRDTTSLQQEALLLKQKMAAVKEEIAKVEQNTGESMATLERLDKIKTKLEDAKQGLHEADNWTLLANDLEEDFESGHIDNISQKLVSMQQSLKILVNIADYEERKLQLEELKNRLEAMTSPSIVQAFTSGNIEQSIIYAKIFTSIDRLPQLLKYYHKCQRGTLLQKWRNQLEIEQDESIAQWIHNFYDVLLSNWHAQIKWFNIVFTQHSATTVLIEIYTDLLTSLDPSFNVCIDAALKQQSDKLGLLLELKQITKQFACNLFHLIENDTTGKIKENMILILAQAIYSPFIQYVGNYAAYEQAFLVQKISSLNCVKDDYPDSVQALGLSVPIVMDLLRESKIRCSDLTENCGICGLLIATKAFLLNYIDQYKIVLRQVDRAKGIEEDWNMFQMCLTLLQNVGEIIMNIQQFEKDLITTVLESMKAHNIEFKYLLLTTSGQKEYDNLIKNVKDGKELSLLESIHNELQKLCVDIHHTTYQVVISPITVQLDLVQTAKAWNENDKNQLPSVDLPDYSFAPQEYITQIGQYLMILPQHLEPFLLRENPALNCALKAADQEYNSLTEEEEGRVANVLLSIIARGTCRSYCDNILTICELKPSACRQLANDIDYLGNILDDLGLSLSESLQQIITLLRLSPEQYQTQTSGCSPRLVAAIRQMRNLTSSG